ncbi:putative porin [Planctomycetota bacterium]
MTRTKLAVGIAMLGAVLAAAGPALAQEDATKKELRALRQQLLEQQKRIDALEALLRGTIAKDVAALRQEVDAVAQQGAAMPFASWAEKVKFKGDFRYRHEFIDDEDKARERQRQRIRIRLGLEAHPTEDVSLHMRMVSGSDAPRSSNQTLDGAFSTKDWMLDRAYVDVHPAALGGVHLLAGKMGYPLFKPGDAQLLFDGDLSFEGLAATYRHSLSEATEVFAGLGSFWLDENSGGADVLLYAAQAGVTQRLSDDARITVGGSTFRYTNLQGHTVLYDETKPYGNTATKRTRTTELDCTAGGDPVVCTEDYYTYDEDYHICEAFAQLDVQAAGMPLSVYGDFVHNRAAANGKDMGWLVGATLGKAKAPGSWQLGYNYRELQADAVVGALTHSDFHEAGTNAEGHKFTAAYQLNKAAQLALTYFFTNDEADTASEDSLRKLRFDFKVKF